MFDLFKKRRRKIEKWEVELLANAIDHLPSEYRHLKKQIVVGLSTRSLIGYSTYIPQYVGFSLNSDLINDFKNRNERGYKIEGIKVFDKVSGQLLDYTIYINDDVISGYSIKGARKYDLDVKQVSTNLYKKTYNENRILIN